MKKEGVMRMALLPYPVAIKECVSIEQKEKWSAKAIFSFAVRQKLVYINEGTFAACKKAKRPSCKSEYKWLRDIGGSIFVEFNYCACCGRGELREYTYNQLRFIEEHWRNR
jgi:hypothetical protein